MPLRLSGRAAPATIDTHAHFFNASDVPVRGFISESFGHNADPRLRPLLRAAAALAEKFTERAPTAAQELEALTQLASARRSAADLDTFFSDDRERSATALSEIVSGTGFERRYRELVPPPAGRSGGRGISPREITDAEDETARAGVGRMAFADIGAKGKAFLQFLRFMLAYRASNIRKYAEAFSPATGAGVDRVLGALVDFDYWLDCPPRSAHDDQVTLHRRLSALFGGYMRPLVGYNPWTDIEQDGAGLRRVLDAWETGDKVFAGVKIYPPMGFMPAGNASGAAGTTKPRPDLKRLDEVLAKFFWTCANHVDPATNQPDPIPVIAHANRSNGRDDEHDEFSSPSAWDKLLCRASIETGTSIVSLGHFGGTNSEVPWTAQFANLMKTYPKVRLYADLGYWADLMCDDQTACDGATDRLRAVLSTRLDGSETVADRVMFASDWLMVSQVPGWTAYRQRLQESLEAIAPAHAPKIMGANALKCFERLNI